MELYFDRTGPKSVDTGVEGAGEGSAGEDFGDGGAASDISAKVPEWHTTRGNYVTTKQVYICIIVLLSKNA